MTGISENARRPSNWGPMKKSPHNASLFWRREPAGRAWREGWRALAGCWLDNRDGHGACPLPGEALVASPGDPDSDRSAKSSEV